MSTNGDARDAGAAIAVEELTGLALQERGLISLLTRQVAESPRGGPRERLERHLTQSRRHARIFDAQVDALRGRRGAPELIAGVVRSGFAAAGAIGASAAQVATAPLAILRQGGRQERLLENAGIEGGILANKLVILTAVTRALESSDAREAEQAIRRVREEALATWEELLEATPSLMSALVSAKAGRRPIAA